MENHSNEAEREPTREPASDPPAVGFPLVRGAFAFYGVLFGVAWLWSWLAGDSLWFAGPEAARAGVRWGRDVAAGVIAAAVAIALSWEFSRRTAVAVALTKEFSRRTAVGRALSRALAGALGRLDWQRCVLLALLSGVAEEAFFRGALQPRIGLVAASGLFALAHFVPRRELVAWSAFSLAAGLLLGVLFETTGNLVAPIVAHAGINAVNLWLLGRLEELEPASRDVH